MKKEAQSFWEEHSDIFCVASAIDTLLQPSNWEDPKTSSMQALTDAGRTKHALPLPVSAGTRVRFLANIGSVLTYDNVPGDGVEGTVIKIKSADGKTTAHGGRVFVSWDDGAFRPVLAEHLRPAKANKRVAGNVALRVATFGDLTAFFTPMTGSSDELVHKATKDLWSFRQDGDGFVIERLFNDSGAPLKV